jgi:hypothetical protein
MVVLCLINCAHFNAFFVYKTQNRKTKYKKLLHELPTSWISETKNPTAK